MMRYSEISRDLSSDSLKYAERRADDYIYKNLREESPPSDIANYQAPYMRQTSGRSLQHCQHHHLHCKQQEQQQHQQFEPILPPPQPFRNDWDYTPMPSVAASNTQTPAQPKLSQNDENRHSCAQRNSKRFSCGSNSSGNGTANGAATISYAAQRKDSICSNGSYSPMENNQGRSSMRCGSKTMQSKSSRRKNSIGCLNALTSSPSSPGCYYCVSNGNASTGKSQSLPAQTSIKNFDTVILNALRVPADELASQITLLDFPVFAAIQPDELTSCAWTKKDKHVVTPNIVAFTKRFNHTSFWTVQEILSGEQPKQRAEILTHFIKVAKKLHELNNLHSLFAIVSAMQSASIYRLKKTWSCLSKKDRQSFERLSDIFSDQNNWENLRRYLESLRLPCIPYLGLFLTDLIFIDLAHPHRGGLEPEQRRNKMNNILRVIANYQASDYGYIMPIESTQKYLTSIRYIEELQNIFEEDQYKKSLKLEPASPSGPSSSSCSSKESFNVDAVTPAFACLNLSPAKTIGSMRIPSGNKFIPGHRKCRSLGSNIFSKITQNHCDANGMHASTSTFGYPMSDNHLCDPSQPPRHLLDDSVLENCHNGGVGANGGLGGDATSNESAEGVLCQGNELKLLNELDPGCIQGCVRRKTVQKEGRKPAVASWQRYWLQIWANSLVYFPPKSFKGTERSDFKREPCKVCPLEGWSAQIIENPKHKNSFELYHATLGTIYKFRTDSAQATQLWTSSICKVAAQRNAPKPLPVNLMSFE